eukprot:3628461-Lingulodinium_polyedra.AAC.1
MVITHTLRCRGAPLVLDILKAAAAGTDADAPEVWGPDDWRNAIVIFLKKGAIPAVYATAVQTTMHT